jgi:hypothetical protein
MLTLEQRGFAADIILFVPRGEDEATFELLSTSWLVQNGDLDVMKVQPGANGEPFAGLELNQAFMHARRQGAGSQGSSCALMALDDFVREFKDLVDSEVTTEFLNYKFFEAAATSSASDSFAEFGALCDVFRRSPKLMRSLVKHRLFNGTISAGGGSCQISMKNHDVANSKPRPDISRSISRRKSGEFMSLPLGNKFPTAETKDGSTRLFPADQRVTPFMVSQWRNRIKSTFQQMQQDQDVPQAMDGGLRGLFIGISAVYYAAAKAGVAEVILPKTTFLERLDMKLSKELEAEVQDKLAISNLTLVHEFLGVVLHDSAWIVCKRDWKAQPAALELQSEGQSLEVSTDASSETKQSDLPSYVAGWVLGFYLSQAHLV